MKVSVVTTVWNVEEWLDRLIQSFLHQTLDECELILVNDCSPDNCTCILNKYKDLENVKVINNSENLGPGVSRQIGINNSSGEYVILVDGDDWLEDDCLERMYCAGIETNSDIVHCNVIHHNDYGLHLAKRKGDVWIEEDFYNFINNKLIRKLIWNQTYYSPLRFREDICSLFRCLELSNKVEKLNYAGYHYNLRPNSLTSTQNIVCKHYVYMCLATIENLEFAKIHPVSEMFKKEFNTINLKINKRFAMSHPLHNNYKSEIDVIDKYMDDNNIKYFLNFRTL